MHRSKLGGDKANEWTGRRQHSLPGQVRRFLSEPLIIVMTVPTLTFYLFISHWLALLSFWGFGQVSFTCFSHSHAFLDPRLINILIISRPAQRRAPLLPDHRYDKGPTPY